MQVRLTKYCSEQVKVCTSKHDSSTTKMVFDLLVQIFDSTERLQSVAKYLLSSCCLRIVTKGCSTELNHTAREIIKCFHPRMVLLKS